MAEYFYQEWVPHNDNNIAAAYGAGAYETKSITKEISDWSNTQTLTMPGTLLPPFTLMASYPNPY